MIIWDPAAAKAAVNGVDTSDVLTYRCDHCGKSASYLSDSWSEITLVVENGRMLHHCLECRSVKQEWKP